MSDTVDEVKANDQGDTLNENEPGSPEHYDIDLILDIPLEVTVELGQVKMPVNELLQLGQGSIIELDKPVGELLEIYVNEKLVAKGEVVIMDQKLGIRVVDIINPVERVKSLG